MKVLSHASRAVDAVLGGGSSARSRWRRRGPTSRRTTATRTIARLTSARGRLAVVRPDQIGNCNLSNPGPNGWFNLAAFAPTPAGAGRPGNAGVGICEGPGTVTVAGGLAKSFLLTEKVRMRFEATFSNILNHPNFAAPPTDVSSTSTFGVTQTVQTSENGGNRVGQLSLRIDF